MPKGIILDTHAWIWLFEESPEMSQATIKQIDKYSKKGQVFISAISVWELSILTAKGRIILKNPIKNWVERSLSQPGFHLVELSPAIAIESNFLPGEFHGDPADRIICATARLNNLTLFTRDKKILKYGEKKHISCFKI